MNTEVGKGATSILEELLYCYIKVHTVNYYYVGNIEYLKKYQELRDYNAEARK